MTCKCLKAYYGTVPDDLFNQDRYKDSMFYHHQVCIGKKIDCPKSRSKNTVSKYCFEVK